MIYSQVLHPAYLTSDIEDGKRNGSTRIAIVASAGVKLLCSGGRLCAPYDRHFVLGSGEPDHVAARAAYAVDGRRAGVEFFGHGRDDTTKGFGLLGVGIAAFAHVH